LKNKEKRKCPQFDHTAIFIKSQCKEIFFFHFFASIFVNEVAAAAS